MILRSHCRAIFLFLLKSSVIPSVAASLLNRGNFFHVLSLQAHKHFKQTFSFFKMWASFVNEFGSVLRQMEYWAVITLALERRLRSPVTQSGRIDNSCQGSLERLHLLPTFTRLFVLSHTTNSSVNWQMDSADTDFLISWVCKPLLSSAALFSV